jgi:hypothetical protein
VRREFRGEPVERRTPTDDLLHRRITRFERFVWSRRRAADGRSGSDAQAETLQLRGDLVPIAEARRGRAVAGLERRHQSVEQDDDAARGRIEVHRLEPRTQIVGDHVPDGQEVRAEFVWFHGPCRWRLSVTQLSGRTELRDSRDSLVDP